MCDKGLICPDGPRAERRARGITLCRGLLQLGPGWGWGGAGGPPEAWVWGGGGGKLVFSLQVVTGNRSGGGGLRAEGRRAESSTRRHGALVGIRSLCDRSQPGPPDWAKAG